MDTQFIFKYLEIQLQKVEIIRFSTVCTPKKQCVDPTAARKQSGDPTAGISLFLAQTIEKMPSFGS